MLNDVKRGDALIVQVIGQPEKQQVIVVNDVTKTSIRDGNGMSWSKKNGCIWGGSAAPGALQIVGRK